LLTTLESVSVVVFSCVRSFACCVFITIKTSARATFLKSSSRLPRGRREERDFENFFPKHHREN
jgi:hypothetical protein